MRLPAYFFAFIFSSGLSNTGTFMQIIAEGWLVAELSSEPFWAGFVGFCGGAPLLFLVFGGAIADRFPRRRLMLASQAIQIVVACLLAYLTKSGQIQIWHVAVLAFCTGIGAMIYNPSYNSFLYDIVGPDLLSEAVSMNAIQTHLSRMLGPALGGVLIASVGAWGCFAINAGSFLVATLMIFLVPIVSPQDLDRGGFNFVGSMKQGVMHVWGKPRIRVALYVISFSTLVVIPYASLLPLYVKKYLLLGARPLGWLWATSAVGSVSTTLIFLRVGSGSSRKWTLYLLIGSLLSSVSLFLLGIADSAFSAGVGIFGIGAFLALSVLVSQAIIQKDVEAKFRGRALGIWGTCFQGMFPIGNFLMGLLAQGTSIPTAWKMGALFLFTFSLIEFFRYFRRERMSLAVG